MVRKMKVPETPLPEPGDDSWEAFAQLSQRFQEHTALEIEKENRLQASEKVWASVGCALAAVAKQRGWEHDSYVLKEDIARQIGVELADAKIPFDSSRETKEKMEQERKTYLPDFLKAWDRAFKLHQNFRNNTLHSPVIEEGQAMADEFLEELAEFREEDYHQFIPINREDQRRLVRLKGLGRDFEKLRNDQKAQNAFLDKHFPRYRKIEWRRDDQPGDDDGGESHPVARPPSGGPPPEGSQSKPIPKLGQGTTPKVNLKPGKQVCPDEAAATPPPKGHRPRQTRNKDRKAAKVTIRFG